MRGENVCDRGTLLHLRTRLVGLDLVVVVVVVVEQVGRRGFG
jgi:hypothetical protein